MIPFTHAHSRNRRNNDDDPRISMNDRAPIRDRTLVLRILVPRLEERLREKMRELEDSIAQTASSSQKTSSGIGSSSSSSGGPLSLNKPLSGTVGGTGGGGGGGGGSSSSGGGDSVWDLEGVSCEPTPTRNRTLWNFHCDGATYPARLVNLPCPVEIHKTLDHAQYYKCQDVAQMLIVYEDEYAMEEAEEKPLDGFPSYYHSGLTTPLKRVVERRFAAREQKAVAPPRTAVADVEEEITQLMEQLQKDEKGASAAAGGSATNKRNKLPSLASTTKILEEVDEVLVDYEPWMDDGGKLSEGVEFDIDDPLAANHPELFLTAAEMEELKQQHLTAQKEAQKEAQKKRSEALEKKEKKQQQKQRKQQQQQQKQQQQQQQQQQEEKAAKANAAAAATTAGDGSDNGKPVVKKKGIASKKNTEEVDQITQAAMHAMTSDDLDIGDDFFKDLDLDLDEL